MSEITTKPPEEMKAWRKANKLSQSKVAKAMGYDTYVTILNHERGTREIKNTHAWQNLMRWCAKNEIEY